MSLSWLGAAGARTKWIVLGTSVSFRYHPAVIAQAFATLGCLYHGRIILGVGSGKSLNEAALDIPWSVGKERLARFREAVDLIRQLWAGERVTFEGECYTTDKATVYGRPEQ